MNESQVEIIKQYLTMDTNYATIINGNYGIGKTHFFKNYLSKEIKDTSLPSDETKKFIPVHISLFGRKSLEEIQTSIFVELLPILKGKNAKLGIGIGKTILRGIAQIANLGNIDDYIEDVHKTAAELLNYDRFVICFDDIDRKSDILKLKDLLGFINSLVENHGAKVLIIANETQLLEDPDYIDTLREKVIGVSIPFIPDLNFAFDKITQERYKSATTRFYDFLLVKKK